MLESINRGVCWLRIFPRSVSSLPTRDRRPSCKPTRSETSPNFSLKYFGVYIGVPLFRETATDSLGSDLSACHSAQFVRGLRVKGLGRSICCRVVFQR